MSEWISMFNNDLYYVNPYLGQVKNRSGKILKGKSVMENGRVLRVTYNLKTSSGIKTLKGHRVIAEAVLRKDLTGIPVGHKNNLNADNRFSNLLIGSRKLNSRNIQVLEYKKGEPVKMYKSIKEFEKETGLYHQYFKNGVYEYGCYKWEKITRDNAGE